MSLCVRQVELSLSFLKVSGEKDEFSRRICTAFYVAWSGKMSYSLVVLLLHFIPQMFGLTLSTATF